ncbi:DNA ligase 4 [Copidosoma floridanum]|uniref:DNA ligase 4 n=1 Tax=Copidosoma floridanum TaxID=29053 RepID=UPI000C6F60B2|nr:DNA ligase 4 [Copidosoma floridanum]
MTSTLDSEIKFTDLCEFLEKLTTLKGQQKFEALKSYTRKCRELATKIKANNAEADTSLFPVYRLLLPSMERERGPYGLKSTHLSQLYVRVFCLGKNSANAEKLTSYKKPIAGATTSKYDDLAERTFWVMKRRLPNEQSSLTIEQVNKFLDDVATHHSTSQSKDELFVHFTRNISALELKWLTRMLLKDLKLGIPQKRVFEGNRSTLFRTPTNLVMKIPCLMSLIAAIHPDAEDKFNVTSSLYEVCKHFADARSGDSAIEIEVFSHVKPMLLERFRIERIGKLFSRELERQYYVQTKFDGERSQMHMKDGRFKYFTRQGFDITSNPSYGETPESRGFLTSSVAPLLNKECRSVILDGELMGWHKERMCFGSKGLSFDVKKITDNSCHQPCFVAYDVLLYNDERLVNKPYSERLAVLKNSFTEKEGVLMLCQTNTVSSVEQLTEIFNVALDNDDEGIVVKTRDCTYKPNVREKSGCYKIKAEYSDGLVQDLDLIILGGYYGQGRCSGQISVFLMGLASPATNRSGMPSEFHAIVTVKSGLSGENLKVIQQRLKTHWKDKKPHGVFGPKSQQPDMWISPKESIILQLRATEITKSQQYPFGYTMRFPRVLKVRLDKPWYDACSTTEFSRLVKVLTASDIDDAGEEKQPKVRKAAPATSKVYDNFVPSKSNDDVVRLSRLFEGREFCVINGDSKLKKNDVEKVLLEHMGKVVANPGDETYCVLVGNPDVLKARNLISREKYDVASIDWLRRATLQENLPKIAEFRPWELYAASPKTKKKLDETYDEFMDSYYEDADLESFKRSMKIVEQKLKKTTDFSIVDMKKVEGLLYETGGVSPFSIFRGIVGYFVNEGDPQKYSFAFMSGQTLQVLSSSANYIFVDNIDSTDILQEYIKELESASGEKSIRIVNSRWIGDCFDNRKLIPVDDYVA